MSKSSLNKVLVKSPAKINLHLEVIGKRMDGYHELAMIMQNIDLSDFIDLKINQNGKIKLTSDSKSLSLNDDNLIIKAANILKKISNNKFGADIFLRKNIPIGAGLAGGSSNAAATLIGLNKIWNLNLDSKTLISIASELGSDVPFFIEGGCKFCFGRGEILEKCNSVFEYGVILLKNPRISISTAVTYAEYSKTFCRNTILERQNVNKIRENLKLKFLQDSKGLLQLRKITNDLQIVVENKNYSVKQSLKLLSNLEKCMCYSMSGSGPTCFALFKNIDLAKEEFHKNKEIFKSEGFDVWVCKFVNTGITFL